MKFALQRCCVTSIYLKQYESSTDAVLNALGVELVDIKQFSC
jgi:heterodisulfide reductase subunit B